MPNFAAGRRWIAALAAGWLLACASLGSALTTPAHALQSEIEVLPALPNVQPGYPRPDDQDLVFFIQRSTNANTIVYAANFRAPEVFNEDQPLEVYWRRFATSGERKPLSGMERRWAFGINSETAEDAENEFIVNLVSYPKRKARLRIDPQAGPVVLTRMGEREVALKYAYVDVTEGGLLPSINHVDVYGIDTATGEAVRERVRPGTSKKAESTDQ